MFNYPVKLDFDEATAAYIVSCRDLPLMHSVGYSREDALLEARDAIITALSIEMDERRPIPLSSAPGEGEVVVLLPVLVSMKAALWNAMIDTGTRKADLARKLGQKGPQIDRLLDIEHSSKVETVEHALHLLNRDVAVTVMHSGL